MLVRGSSRWQRKIRRWVGKVTITTIIFSVCCYVYGSKIEPNWIEVVPIELAIPHLDRAFDEFKIVQISDLHVSYYMPEGRLNRIIKLVNQQQADAIAITGDFITNGKNFDAERLKQKLNLLESKSGILSILGNHDHWWKKMDLLERVLAESKVTNLDNQVYAIERGTQKLFFAGLDDPYWGKPDLQQVIAQLPNDSIAILLVHEPDYIETSAPTHEFVLQLSGHSHGGQIRIPFLEPLILPHGAKKYYAGLDWVEDTITYTNRGLGMTNLPIRLGSRPEITVFTLHGAA